MNQTARHGMPMLASGQAQKEVTHNDALMMIDRRMQLAVVSRRLSSPPSQAKVGSAFIVPGGAEREWIGQADRIASFDGYSWSFDTPQAGWLAWIADEGIMSIYDGSWSDGAWPVTSLRIGDRSVFAGPPAAISGPAGGDVIDIESRRAIDQILTTLRAQGLIQQQF
jgi:hypothetical protein